MKQLLTMAAFMLCFGVALGQKYILDKPIHIEADRVELDEQKGVSTYHGKVKIKQGDILIRANKLTVNIEKEKIKRLQANGNPVIMTRSGDVKLRAEANKMEYFASEGRVVIQGGAHLWQGVNEFSGERIEYFVQKDYITAAKSGNSKNRVHVILRPQPKKNTDEE